MSGNHCIINLSTSEEEDEALSHEWHVNYSPLILYVAACHKHHQPTAIPDILNRGLNTFSAVGRRLIDAQSALPHHLGSGLLLSLNNSSNLFEISITLTLRLRPPLNWKNLESLAARSVFCFPLTCRQLWLQLGGNCVFKNGRGRLSILTSRRCIRATSLSVGEVTGVIVTRHIKTAPLSERLFKEVLLFAVCCRCVRCFAVILFAMLSRGMEFTKGKFRELILHPLNLAKENSWHLFVHDTITTYI